MFDVPNIDVPIVDNSGNVLVTNGNYINEPIFGGSLYYYETGPKTGEPIVLVHGLGTEGLSYWRYVVDMLAPTYRVILLDLPGFGRSGRENALYSPAQYAKLLEWFIRQRTTTPITLVGHSMGGAISLYYAATYPENLKRLIIFDAAGILHRAAFTKHFIEMAGLDNPLLGGFVHQPESKIHGWMSTFFTKAELFNKPLEIMLDDPILSKYILRRFSPAVIAGYAMAKTDYSKVVNKIKTDTTIIWGREDRISPPRVANVLNRRIPGSRLIWIDKAGHNPILEDIVSTNRLLREVLQISVNKKNSHSYKTIKSTKRDRRGSCTKKDAIHFTGYYSELRIIECHQVRLKNVTTPSLFIAGSDINVIGGYFENDATPITVRNSLLKMTNATIKGKVGIEAYGSKLDLAGVDIGVRKVGVEAGDSTSLICSLCEFDAPTLHGTVHGIYNLKSGDSL